MKYIMSKLGFQRLTNLPLMLHLKLLVVSSTNTLVFLNNTIRLIFLAQVIRLEKWVPLTTVGLVTMKIWLINQALTIQILMELMTISVLTKIEWYFWTTKVVIQLVSYRVEEIYALANKHQVVKMLNTVLNFSQTKL